MSSSNNNGQFLIPPPPGSWLEKTSSEGYSLSQVAYTWMYGMWLRSGGNITPSNSAGVGISALLSDITQLQSDVAGLESEVGLALVFGDTIEQSQTSATAVASSIDLLGEDFTNIWNAGLVTGVDAAELAIDGNYTITLANRTASSLMGNPGTSAAKPSDIVIGTGLSLSTSGTLSSTSSVRVWAPLVNGDLPGPSLVANGAGECIMVPIT